ncbi:MAG: RNA-binding S4 domain-containing protein [Gammaproteobacteria bacterium]|nr:MAG: RNA-binding S4 domain-containing protein [Gammaproteobacteria bacterium]
MTTDEESNAIIAELESEFVELYKILKFEGLTDSGGMAKQMIADGRVSVNGEIETRKRKKIIAGDKIIFSGQSIEVKNKTACP